MLAGCSDSGTDAEPQIPLAIVNESLLLTQQEYTALRFDGGMIYHPGGVRGLLIIRQSASVYLAFERNCPFQPYDACAQVEIDASRLFLVDKCCNSQFDLKGQVQAGPARRPLRQYGTALSGNTLTITN
ncbi:hypothetical protein FY528_10890 [Hymenobacter lutimineralis]|uniref:Rieske domain-containing protein n=1 Tax=Hymenobacter lutimineralis TaxID=2606448 RepID=A0A5D6V2W2_9BACT|nr:hypothetical protein HER32_11140 [Hymenobacter sp. BT18]TYZ09352.1 hypothetical protein FY528_10890 [Hymenobacter lutimineralis]